MVVNIILKKCKSIFVLIVTLWKRALCCFRRRKLSTEFVPLTQIGVVADHTAEHNGTGYLNEWNEPLAIQTKPKTIDQHIQFYRQKTISARQIQDDPEEVDENFFDDMAPTITKQTKLLINNKNEHIVGKNRLSLAPENVNIVSKDLEEWEDTTGWEDETLDYDTKKALIETRRQARQKKIWEQQQRKQEKFTRPGLGAKVYS